MPNPYPGPRPFSADEYRIFAGRDHEISELTSLVVSHQVVLLYAQSGAGKTSLVNAGLKIPLAERGVQVHSTARVGIPLDEGVQIGDVANVFTYSAIGDLLPETEDESSWRQKAALLDAFRRLPEQKDEFGESGLRLFVLDQLEEIFGVYPQRWQDREAFFEQLAEVLRNYRELRVLLVLREDYLAAFNEFARILPEGARTRYHLERLREPDAISAVRKPLESTPIRFDLGVAETMVRDLMTIMVVDPTGDVVTVPGEFVEPVQLQVVCFTLLDRMPENSDLITLGAYREFGDPDQALESFYRDAIAAAVKITGVEERELRDWCESRLITPAGTRGLVFQGRSTTAGISNRVVEVLEQKHLVRPEIRSGSRWYEITHDRFIRPIQRSNLSWRAEKWSKSFEVQYAEAIRNAAARTGIAEGDLRTCLDSLANQAEGKAAREPVSASQEALDILAGAGLLRREDEGEKARFSLIDIGIAEAIRLANRGWRGENWPEAKRLRELQLRADQWMGDQNLLLLTRPELQEAQRLLSMARVSGVGFNDNLNAFLEAGARRVGKSNLRWAWMAAAVFAAIALVSFFVPSTGLLRWKVLCCSITGIGAAIGMASVHKHSEIVFLSLRVFMFLVLFCCALGLSFSSLNYSWGIWVVLPLGLILGFFACAFMLGVAAALQKRMA